MARSGAVYCSGRVAAARLIHSRLSSLSPAAMRFQPATLVASTSIRFSYETPARRSSPPIWALPWQASLVQPWFSKMAFWMRS